MASQAPATILRAARSVLRKDARASFEEVASAAGVSRATVYRYFRSRTALLEALDLEPDPGTRERILAAAAELIGRDGLNRLSIDELANLANVSRASVYRTFPGKSALFAALVAEYSPFGAVHEAFAAIGDDEPEVVLPAVGRAVAHAVEPRIGIVRSLFFEITGGAEDALEGATPTIRDLLATVGGYLATQMAAGRLRPMHPLLASQMFVGPLFMHLITRPVAKRVAGLEIPLDAAVDALTAAVLEGLSVRKLKEARA